MNNQLPTQPTSMGPFQALGRVFGMVGAVVNVASNTLQIVDTSVTRTGKLITAGFDAIDIPVAEGLADLNTGAIVAEAKNKAKIAIARAEADEIIRNIKPVKTAPAAKPKATKAA